MDTGRGNGRRFGPGLRHRQGKGMFAAMPKLRVLIVDDAVVVRKIIGDALSLEADIEVTGNAPNGRLALAKIPLLKPDLVVTDMEMPEMDGMELTREIRRLHGNLPIIIFSGTSTDAARSTLDALRAGADDFVTKPTGMANLATAVQSVRAELGTRIRSLVARRGVVASVVKPVASFPAAAAAPSIPSPAVALRPAPVAPRRVDLIVIGVVGSVDTFDSAEIPDILRWEILVNSMGGLLMNDADNNLVPVLATGYEVSADGLEYTFTLRQGVTFPDGTPLTPQVVK